MEAGKPTVLHVSPWYLPHLGGLERHVEAISRGLKSFNFVIVTPRIPGTMALEEPAENIRIVRFGPVKYPPAGVRRTGQAERDWVARIARLGNLNRILTTTGFDVLHIHRPPLIELAYLTAKWHNVEPMKVLAKHVNRLRTGRNPRVFTDHGLFVVESTASSIDLTWFMGFVLEEFEHVICVDRGGFLRANQLRESDPRRYSRAQIHLVPQAIDTDTFRPAPFPVTPELIVGYTGRWERDGMPLLQSLVEARLPGIQFHIAGGATERDLAKYTEALSRAAVVLEPNIQRVDELSRFYQGIHVLVDFYRGDGCGRSVLEAMSCGRPVVRIQAQDTHPVVHLNTGILVEPELSAIARSLLGLKERKDWLSEMGARARTSIEKEYRIGLVLSEIERIYRDCLRASETSA